MPTSMEDRKIPRRILTCLLFASILLWSCTTHVSRPISAIESERPEVVRVTVRGGEIVPVAFPTLTPDSLIGETFTSPRELQRHRTRIAIPREEIVSVAVERFSAAKTVLGVGVFWLSGAALVWIACAIDDPC